MSINPGVTPIQPQSFFRYNKPEARPYVTVALDPEHGDFGPFTPGTQTSGIGEALRYAATTGAMVFVKNGTYSWNDELTNYVQAGQNVILIGESRSGVQINLLNSHFFGDNASPAHPAPTNVPFNLAHLENLTFNNLGGPTYPYSRVIFIATAQQEVENVTFNCTPGVTSFSGVEFYKADFGQIAATAGPTNVRLKDIIINQNGSTAFTNGLHIIANNAQLYGFIDNLFSPDMGVWLAGGYISASLLQTGVQLGANGNMSGSYDVEQININGLIGSFSVAPGSNGNTPSHIYNLTDIVASGAIIANSAEPVYLNINNYTAQSYTRINILTPQLFSIHIRNYRGLPTTAFNSSHFDFQITSSLTNANLDFDIDGTYSVDIFNNDTGGTTNTFVGRVKVSGLWVGSGYYGVWSGASIPANLATIFRSEVVGFPGIAQLASGTTYNNPYPTSLTLLIPVTLTPTSSASASAAIAVGSSPSTLSTVQTLSAAAGASPTGGVLQATVPILNYYQLTLTNATAGQPIVLQQPTVQQ